MQIIQGDILRNLDPAIPTVILHGCNCFHIMGAGIAKYLRGKWPEVYRADIKQTAVGDKGKLGTYSVARISENLRVLNCYTQFDLAKYPGQHVVDYKAISSCFERIAKEYRHWQIRMPKIGCGLAGGDWEKVKALVEQYLENEDVRVYEI